MAQHDYSIANQTAGNLRSDLNNVLAAIVSNNSGATAPTDTYANMFWYDTTANILKMRNEADGAWISLGYLDQTADAFRILDNTQVVNTSGTQTGLLGDQSTATWEDGTGTTESLVSPAKIKAAIETRILVATETSRYTISANTWTKRRVVQGHNDISGASVSSNIVTLPAGTYMMQAFVTSDREARDWLQARIRNTTGGSDIAVSSVQRLVDGDADSGNAVCHMTGVVTLSTTSNIELQSYTTATNESRPSDNYAAGTPQGANLIVTKLA